MNHISSRKFLGGYYSTIDQVLTELNRHFRQMTVDITLKFDTVLKKVMITGDGKYSVCFYAPTAYILGFEPDARISVNSRRLAPYCADIKAGLYTLFVYSDIVQYQLVRDSFSPLLHMVDIAGQFGDVITWSYDKVHSYLFLGNI